METGQYLIPDNLLAGGVIAFLFALFIGWCALFFGWAKRLRRHRAEIERLFDVSLLSDFLRLVEEGSLRSADELEREGADVFRRYRVEKGVDEGSPVGQHVRAIFDAGLKNARLDVAEITKHTAAELFKPYPLLRSVLAVFIIIGLLGTLLGLAASLAHLSPPTTGGVVQSASELSQGLGKLLTQLRSAFAPSIWGVALTLAGVLSLSSYLHRAALPARKELEGATLTVWVPRLFPSTSQQFLERLRRSERHMEQSLEAVRGMAELSCLIQEEVVRFRENLEGANEPLSLLAQSAGRLNEFNDGFGRSVGALTSFQAELKGLYGKMVEDSTTFHDSVGHSIRESAEFQKNVQAALMGQTEYIRSLMATMQSYEAAYVKERGQLDGRLREVLSEAKNAYSATVAVNRDLIKELGDPLRGDLRSSLAEIANTLQRDLKEIHVKLGGLGGPVDEAASELAGASRSMSEHTAAVAERLERQADAQVTAHAEQLNRVDATNRQIVGLLTELSALNRSQSESAGKLGSAVADLTGNVASLSEGVNVLGRVTKARSADTREDGSAPRHDPRLRQVIGTHSKDTGGAGEVIDISASRTSAHTPGEPSSAGEPGVGVRSPGTEETGASDVEGAGRPADAVRHRAAGDEGRHGTDAGRTGEEDGSGPAEPRAGLLGFFSKYK